MFEILLGPAPRKSSLAMAYSALAMLTVMSLTGCADERTGGPVSAGLSAPADTTGGPDSDRAAHSTPGDVGEEGGEKDPIVTMISTPSGVTVTVSWEPPPDFNVAGYTLYYGKHAQESQSEESSSEDVNPEASQAEEPSWCALEERTTVAGPSATITGLEPHTPYVLAIRAFMENDSESRCSNPIVVITPQADT